jgi:hypothetical protein
MNNIRTPQKDDFTIYVSFKEMPIGIIYYYNNNLDSRPYKKINKTQCWDGCDRMRATKPSSLYHIVRLSREDYISYWQNYGTIENKQIMDLALQHQYV